MCSACSAKISPFFSFVRDMFVVLWYPLVGQAMIRVSRPSTKETSEYKCKPPTTQDVSEMK